MLMISADLENLTNLQPQGGCDDPNFSYFFKVPSLSLPQYYLRFAALDSSLLLAMLALLHIMDEFRYGFFFSVFIALSLVLQMNASTYFQVSGFRLLILLDFQIQMIIVTMISSNALHLVLLWIFCFDSFSKCSNLLSPVMYVCVFMYNDYIQFNLCHSSYYFQI